MTVRSEATYASAAVGTNKTLTVVYTLGGADAAHYIKPVDDTMTLVNHRDPLTVEAPTLTKSKDTMALPPQR